MAGFPSLTQTWHRDAYPTISPNRPELSTVGKTIIITGGGTGIGAGIANAFATAGSTQIAILGRRSAILDATAQSLEKKFSGLKVLPCVANVSNKAQVDTAFDFVHEQFGPIDVLVDNAGAVSSSSEVADIEIEEGWAVFETNTKGSILVAQAFKRAARKERAVVIDISSVVVMLPAFPGAAAYTASKLASTKIWNFFGAENPSIRVVSIQPGQIETDMARKIGMKGQDDVNLPSNFAVWLASDEAQFLDGKCVCANWDVEEMVARREELETTDLATIKFQV